MIIDTYWKEKGEPELIYRFLLHSSSTVKWHSCETRHTPHLPPDTALQVLQPTESTHLEQIWNLLNKFVLFNFLTGDGLLSDLERSRNKHDEIKSGEGTFKMASCSNPFASNPRINSLAYNLELGLELSIFSFYSLHSLLLCCLANNWGQCCLKLILPENSRSSCTARGVLKKSALNL